MKNVLFVDSCIRGEASRSKKIADSFLNNLSNEYQVKHLDLKSEDLKPLVNDFFEERQELLEKNELNHPRFHYAHEFASTDIIVIAAPFWDLSFPALLKIYIENVSVDGITFQSTSEGLKGLCKATNLYYFTSRGGFYHDSYDDQGTAYIKCLCSFFGIDNYECVDADGMDVQGFNSNKSLETACQKAKELAENLSK